MKVLVCHGGYAKVKFYQILIRLLPKIIKNLLEKSHQKLFPRKMLALVFI